MTLSVHILSHLLGFTRISRSSYCGYPIEIKRKLLFLLIYIRPHNRPFLSNIGMAVSLD